MAPDYTKHKNAELEHLLRARSLPHTGKKADLIARLVQDDSEKAHPAPPSGTAPSSGPATATADDEIDWDDDAAKAPTEPTAPPTLTPLPAHAGAGRAANPLAVPNQVPAIDPAATHDLTVTQSPPTTSPPPPAASPSPAPPLPTAPALAPVSVESELAKRLARARKYNLSAEAVFEAEKALERFRKFGNVPAEVGAVGGLEGALPERGRGKGKRGREEEGVGEGGGKDGGKGEGEKEKGAKRVDSRRREGRGGGRGKSKERGRGKSGERIGRGRSKEVEGGKKGGEGVGEKDRLAAEARKARFGTL
ncbi:hypothetical protein MMC32_006862 [Xylographa parallela]|nr:hypothetical protein [Xylographa parallela]